MIMNMRYMVARRTRLSASAVHTWVTLGAYYQKYLRASEVAFTVKEIE